MRTQVDDVGMDTTALAENSLLQEISGAYTLHDLTHEYLQLLTRTAPDIVSTATSRQAVFLASPETLHTYMDDDDDNLGGPYSLVMLWATVQKIDSSRKAWDEVIKVEKASRDVVYMREAGSLLLLMVRTEEQS